uniref:Uncharacterized protein n=1 Tax=Thermus tengchongensis TaxID=1214928 RepID=A0A7V4AMS1_9DEIN
MRLVLDRNSLEIEVYMEGDSLPAFWLAPYEPGEEVGEDEEVMEAPDWMAGILSPSSAWANWPWTSRPPLGHREGCRREA